MSVALTSEVTQLLYRVTPPLNFAQTVSDLCAAFSSEAAPYPNPTWDCDDIAIIDLPTGRIIVGFSDTLPGVYAGCLTIATAQTPRNTANPLDTRDQADQNTSVADLLHRRFPSDAQNRQIFDQPLAPDLIDRVVDALFATADGFVPRSTMDADQPVEPPQISTVDADDPVDMDRLMQQFTSELSTQTSSIFSRAIATATSNDRRTADKKPSNTKFRKPAKSAANDAKPKTGLFWRRGQKEAPIVIPSGITPVQAGQSLSSSAELKAIREALYTPNPPPTGGAGGILQRTKNNLQSLRLLRKGGANATKQRGSVDPN